MALEQVGMIAVRGPAGDFKESVPIYKEVKPVEMEHFDKEVKDLFSKRLFAYLEEQYEIKQRSEERKALFARINAQKGEALG